MKLELDTGSIEEKKADLASKNIEVDNFFFDMWSFMLNEKLVAIRNGKSPKVVEMGEFDFSDMILKLLNTYPEGLDGYQFLRKLVEFQFRKTRTIYAWILYTYIFSMMLYAIQLDFLNPQWVKIVNVVQLVIQTGIFLNEIIQYRDSKEDYFKSFFNWVDNIHYLTFLVYFWMRISDPETTIPRIDDGIKDPRSIASQTVITTLNILLITTATVKVMYFVRVHDKFGWIVEMVSQCLSDIVPFTLFFFFVLIVFGTIFHVAGAN